MNVNMTITSGPCWECENRKLNCHSNCREYEIYKFKMDYYNRRNNKRKKINQDYAGFKQDGVYRVTNTKIKRCAR